ncbi:MULTISPECIES: metalloregulator ArsR/SmtB family transcription factor [unclassified Staphylococcus]|uniref:ArsR/SmtB family transcription factor n=1 Tax=unclassified Staphylococcus TaxID=91994 RepID=UPI0021CF0CBB|nr:MULTISPECIES: metalloregulator ArsR/SmtB family transcription factor [unclassified Staphylococcus]UXR77933.1 metalloregulator ArsR/SmtB family transcription factor [Staphylococcus sp. IVB6227]UXR82094.1 metalloregulator ArsR/SmtB family transcription factor [Staphylococcus sp. IVB6214]
MSYQVLAVQLKVLADANRLEIIDLLSCGELCACDILAHFEFSQPTLSHHMKALVESGMVIVRKEGNKRMYRLNAEPLETISVNLNQVHRGSEQCICKTMKGGTC